VISRNITGPFYTHTYICVYIYIFVRQDTISVIYFKDKHFRTLPTRYLIGPISSP